jgi:lipopolysaccharide biosynthesis glycosyltransferase
MLNIFIGWDSREPIAFPVLANSIMQRATAPVSITALIQKQLRSSGQYSRERGPTESTEFSLTRFLVPYLSGYKGISLFLDCDMLCRADITDLEFIAAKTLSLGLEDEGDLDSNKAVWVCQHNYTPKGTTKFLGQQQTAYPRKNWSSLILFVNERCKILTKKYVNSASGLDLHRFNWLKDEHIGSLPLEWNHLVGEYPPNLEAKILHYTNGGPWFDDYKNTDHAAEWFTERDGMLAVQPNLSVSAK